MVIFQKPRPDIHMYMWVKKTRRWVELLSGICNLSVLINYFKAHSARATAQKEEYK